MEGHAKASLRPTAVTPPATTTVPRWNFTWQNGRELTTASKTGTSVSYTYDADGMRKTKTVNGVPHTYYYNGGTLLREVYGDTILDFFYNANGTPIAMRQSAVGSTNYTIYYYITNLQGDVIRLVDHLGQTAAYYRYDPYGKVIEASGSHANINPLRYRGYYYDVETGLYYLQSRYYDPQVSRFINADAFTSTGQGLLGNNMFAYCGNNPVCRVDPTGRFFLPVAIDLIEEWLIGDGSDKQYGEDDEISKKLKKHKKTRNVVDKAIEDYKSGTPKEEWSHGTMYFGASVDLDLWLAVRRCSYELDIKEERQTLNLWFFKIEQVRYIVTVEVHDRYDFTKQEWDGVGNYLNNYAMYAHDWFGIGKDYDWYATFTYTTPWETVG